MVFFFFFFSLNTFFASFNISRIKEIYIDWAINPWLRINDGGSNVSAALSEKISALNNLMSSFFIRCSAHKLHGSSKKLLVIPELKDLIDNHMKINNHLNRRYFLSISFFLLVLMRLFSHVVSVLSTEMLKKAQQKVPAKKTASFSATRFADSGRVFQRQYELSTEIWNIWEKMIQNMTNKEENLPSKPTAKDWDNILGLRHVSCKILVY